MPRGSPVHDSTCQRGMYKTYQEEDKDEAVPRTVTNDDPQNNSMPIQTETKDVARRLAMPTAALVKGGPNVQEIPRLSLHDLLPLHSGINLPKPFSQRISSHCYLVKLQLDITISTTCTAKLQLDTTSCLYTSSRAGS
jgi:hypothetical protein